MGRDHTIHAAVAGYVKYYRDPQRHPKRQYIGVVFNRDEKLPYPVGVPRRRKLSLTAVIRKPAPPSEETLSSSGIPLFVTRHDPVKKAEKDKTHAAAEKVAADAPAPVPLRDGNSVIARLLQEKIKARKMNHARKLALEAVRQEELEARKATRIFRLQSDYSYRESNWEIGRLVGDVGVVPGTEKTWSRKLGFRLRRSKRMAHYLGLKRRKLEKVARRQENARLVRVKRERGVLERSQAAAAVKATQAAASAAIAAATKVKETKGDKDEVKEA
jgi:protein phosphatase inhibitor 2